MKILFSILFSLITTNGSFGQKKTKPKESFNLVANGSFEDINVCTEFDARCEPDAWFYLPNYIEEPQGNDSNKYEVIAFANTRYKGRAGNYLYTKLLCPLKEGKRYRFSMWVVTPKNEFDHLDTYFTYLEPTNHNALNTITEPAFSLDKKSIESTHRRWIKCSYTYTATGEERFLTIGNFSDKPIDIEKSTANNKQGEILYGIDNISLVPLDNKEPMCNEYFANIKQLYDQNYRHPAKMIHSLPLDTTLLQSAKRNAYTNSSFGANNKAFTKVDTLFIPDILFRYNSSDINTEFMGKLQTLITNIRIRHFSAIEIVGHTDNIGSKDFNNNLSLQRANAIKNYILLQLSLPGEMIATKGMGEISPIATNETPEGRKSNRRVEIILKQ